MIEDYPYAKFGAQRILDKLEGVKSPKWTVKVKKKKVDKRSASTLEVMNQDAEFYPSVYNSDEVRNE